MIGIKGCSFVIGLSVLFFVSASCVTSDDLRDLPPVGAERCEYLSKKIRWSTPVTALNRISDLFDDSCYEETVTQGTRAREAFAHKKYSVVKESLELFVAEGTLTDYVLESYERGYLSFLIAMSLIKLNRNDQLTVELNRFYHEEVAATYNHGQDPVNALLQAALWDNFPRDGYSSRPFWLWLSKAPEAQAELREFAAARVKAIDQKTLAPKWSIAALGQFPELDWSLKFTNSNSGYLAIKPVTPFESGCWDANTVLVPTSSWFQKIALRHSQSYHPLVNAKTWIRLPVGLVYGISTVVAGAGIMIGGCGADASIDGKGQLCQLSIQGGTAMIASTGDVVGSTLRPDLRHWEKLPEAIIVTNVATSGTSECLKAVSRRDVKRLL